MTTSASLSSAGDESQSQESPSMGDASGDSIADDPGDTSKNIDPTTAKKKKKKKIRPKLKPISSPNEIGKMSPGDDLFSNFLPAARDTSPVNSAADEEASDAGKKKKKKLRPKLKPISSKEEIGKTSPGGDDLGFGDILTKHSDDSAADRSSDVGSDDKTNPRTPARTTAPNTEIDAGKVRISTKIQPRSSPLYTDPRTPDDDEYDAYGFDLVKTPCPTGMAQKESVDGNLTTSVGVPPPPPAEKEFPLISLRRVLSSDSYISDDSSSLEEDELYHRQVKRVFQKGDELHNVVNDRKREKRGNAKYSPPRATYPGSTCSQATEQSHVSSVTYGTSVLGTDARSTTTDSRAGQSDVHMLSSCRGGASHSFSSSSDSSDDGESSYFRSNRALPQSHHNQHPPPISNSHLYPNAYQYPQGVALAPSEDITPPLLMRSNSLPLSPPSAETAAARHPIQVKLTMSEEDSSTSGKRFSDSDQGEDDGDVHRSSPTRQTSTPYSHGSLSSVDDQVIANELSAYSLSIKLRRASASSPPSGRHAPVDGHHANSILPHSSSSMNAPSPVRSFYASPQRAMLAATAHSTAKPRPHHDSSFLSNLREGWIASSVASVSEGSFISSPRGAFGEPEVEERSPLAKSPGTQTPQSNLQSLAYSDEEDIERRISRRGSQLSCLDCKDPGEQEAMTGKNLPNVKVYSSRWVMLLYMSLLNLLSDLTCYSIAPISILSAKTLDIDPESLVVLFLAANVIGTALEPTILGRFGIRRTVLLGSLLLMAGNVVKSGSTSLMDEQTILYVGFFISGLSQPLYQCCTPAIVVNSWFPESERKYAKSMVLNSKQIGIGCAFVLSTLLVKTGDDVLPYFHLLSIFSIVLFVGVAMQFEDAPPTPPSASMARVIRGTVERPIFISRNPYNDVPRVPKIGRMNSPKIGRRARSSDNHRKPWQGGGANNGTSKTPLLPSPASFSSIENDGTMVEYSSIAQAPSVALDGPTELAMEHIGTDATDYDRLTPAPLPMIPGPVAGGSIDHTPVTLQTYGSTDASLGASLSGQHFSNIPSERSDDVGSMHSPFPNLKGDFLPRGGMPFLPVLDYYNFSQRWQPRDHLPPTEDDGSEPIMVQTPRHVDLDIRNAQLWHSLRACFSRKGFSHCVLAFATSGIVTNTLTTFMGYLAALNEDGREHDVGIVGGAFQLLILVSSIMSGRWTGQTSRYYMVIIALLALGALVLALCDANLDSGERLWTNLLMVAVFTGPLQHLSAELGVEVAYPLSENTVLVIQQLFSNLLSAACIPAFKLLRDFSASAPDFTYSFYLLVLIHALSTIYFASFNAQYLSHEEEEHKKRSQTPPAGISYPNLNPKPPLGRDQPWGKKYPFLIPSST
ncbi:hypothetical protein ACHAXR_012171 [Thalassiosira sp. AJA248-18]